MIVNRFPLLILGRSMGEYIAQVQASQFLRVLHPSFYLELLAQPHFCSFRHATQRGMHDTYSKFDPQGLRAACALASSGSAITTSPLPVCRLISSSNRSKTYLLQRYSQAGRAARSGLAPDQRDRSLAAYSSYWKMGAIATTELRSIEVCGRGSQRLKYALPRAIRAAWRPP